MHIDRYMVNLFFEIRRNLPSGIGTDLKIADPEIAEKLIELHHSIEDENIKRLIEVFFERAGDAWAERLSPKKRFYRANEASAKNKRAEKKRSSSKATKPKLIYRGRVVED